MTSYKRWQTQNVKEALGFRRVVILSGARQSGKTTLAKDLNLPDVQYRTLDDLNMRRSAIADPSGFVEHGEELLIIDEIQKVPELIEAVKKNVDENKQYGRFLLTGSANIRSLPTVTESLAGRVSNIRLRPLSMGEIHGKSPNFLPNAMADTFNVGAKKYTKADYIKLALMGGYPEIQNWSFRQQKKWHKDYISALIERDLQDIENIRRQDAMYDLLKVVSAWSTKEINIQAIQAELSIQRPTLQSYMNALETLYLIDRLPAWTKTDYGAVRKKDKILMADTGLMASMLNWTFEKVEFDSEKNGKLIEAFVYQQLMSCAEANDDDYKVYYYRDAEKREIDFIIEYPNGKMLGIEVKAGTNITKQSFKHLHWFKNTLVDTSAFQGIILYTGQEVLSFGDEMLAVPINSLWA